MDKIKENFTTFHAIFKKLLRHSVRKNSAGPILQKFNEWVAGTDFEVDLLHTIAAAVITPDEFFYASNEFGGTSEVKIGSSGYVLICLVLYCRYLNLWLCETNTAENLNHGLKLNLRRVPVARLCLDIDIDNALLSDSMASGAMKFVLWNVLHFVEPGSRVLVTQNADVVNTKSFHVVTDTQFDVISFEAIRNYIQHQVAKCGTMKIDTVNNWSFPHGRFHSPRFICTSSRDDLSCSFNDFAVKSRAISATEPMSFDEWMLMMPVNPLDVDGTYTVLDEMNTCPPHQPHCIMNTGYYVKYLANLHLSDEIDLDIGLMKGHIKPVRYIKLFRTANRIDIPREKTIDNRIVFDSFSINLSSLRLLFSSYRRRIIESAVALQQPDNIFESAVAESIPNEYYEILLHTRLHFNDDFDMKQVFGSLPDQTSAVNGDIEQVYSSFCSAKDQDYTQPDRVKEFFAKKFTFTFRANDIRQLNVCYNFPSFPINIVVVLTSSLWNMFLNQDPQDTLLPIVLKTLYLYHCQKHALEMFISRADYDAILLEASEAGFEPMLTGTSYFGGQLSPRSLIGAKWSEITDPNVKIMLHILVLALQNGHFFSTLALTVSSHVWENDVVSNAIMFLLNLFERNRFLKQTDVDSVNVDSTDTHLNETPVQMLYTYAHFLEGIEEKNLMGTLKISFRFSFLTRMLLDMQCAPTLDILQTFMAICNFRCVRSEPEEGSSGGRNGGRNGGSGGGGKKNNKKAKLEMSRFKGIYEILSEVGSQTVLTFLIKHVVCMYKNGYFTFIYEIDQYIFDDNMSAFLPPLLPDITDSEPSVYNFWIRREMGIYHSFLGTFDAHSPALFSGVYIQSPSFLTNTDAFNMFNYHLKNRIFNVLAKGVHFCEYLNYQQTALILCGTIYAPSSTAETTEYDGESLKYAVSSLQVCHDDLKSDLPYPKQLMSNLYKTRHLKYLYQWFYMIICEISQGITIAIARPSAYIMPFQDPNSEFLSMAQEKKNSAADDENDDESLNFTCVGRELLCESEILKFVRDYLHSHSSAISPLPEDSEIDVGRPKYLQRLVPSQMSSAHEDDLSPYNVVATNFFNADDMWLESMNMVPSPDLLATADIDETIRNHIVSVGGGEFELFILLLVSWHIRTLHKNFFTPSLYMQYIQKHRQALYDELTDLVANSIGPFFLSHGQKSLVHYFQKFTKSTRLDVDSLSFHIQPPRGYVLPSLDANYIGEVECSDDDEIHAGVVSFIIQSQFNRETIVDLLKCVTKCTRPINRERTAMVFLNRPRTGKNAFSDTLTQTLFKTSHLNSYRHGDLVNCESDNVGNKMFVPFNRNLVCSFDEVESLPNVFKTVCNNACLSGRLLFKDANIKFYINAHPILISNIDPVCKECAVVDRLRVFDRYYQFTSLNTAVVIRRNDGVHQIDIPEVNTVFAVQNLLQTLPKENTTVGEHGLYILIWQISTLFAYTQQEPCTQRFTKQMQRTMSRFVHATDPAKYIIAHKITKSTGEPIPIQTFKASIQTIISQDRTIPRNTSFNLNSIIHDVLDRLQRFCFVDKGIEYISVKITP